ncbi:MAG: hypothetical protein ACRD2I_07300 [Vicinamibacterales bacterium]
MLWPRVARAQDESSPWMLMSDGVLFATVNHQGGPRGGDEILSTNWWMGMASRSAGRGQLTLTGMLSLDPATATARGYREIFQAGESYKGLPIVDRQHPHDLIMQAAVLWRVPIDYQTGFTIAAAPVGEPALGPTAFMHRPSAAENPAAPLGHHTLDSTHIAMGVISVALDHGPFTLETSLFNGREPDDNRWDVMDPGALDSWSVREWYEPSPAWQFQVSHGLLKQPEAGEPGDIRRTTASASWLGRRADGFMAATIAVGRNDTSHGAFHALLAEGTVKRGRMSFYGRLELAQKETGLLADQSTPGTGIPLDARSGVTALTLGTVRDVARWRSFEIGVGGDVTGYRVPDTLQPSYGSHPTSFHLFLRVRPPAGHMGRMWNMRMTRPMQ